LEETLHNFEEVNKVVLTGANDLSGLEDLGMAIICAQESRKDTH
jgi:hypothetical protein